MAVEIASIFEKSSALSLEARQLGNQLYAQKSHDKNVHKRILLQYAKSVAFAVEHDELALAYGNRSALFLHLKEYEKCLIDVGRALKLTSSAELRTKLESRKAICVDSDAKKLKNANVKKKRQTRKEKKSLEKKVEVRLNLPNFPPSADVPNASEAVTVEYNEKFGRHVVATRDIKPGEVVIAERAYVCFPIVARRHLICSHCLSFAWNGIPCDHCAFVMYCGEACKKDAWSEYHDVECALFLSASAQLFYREDYLPYLMVASRLLIKAVKSEGVDAVIDEFSKANSGKCEGVNGWMVDGKLRFRSCIHLHGHPDNKKFDDSVDAVISHIIEVLHCCTSLFDSKESKISDETVSQLEVIVRRLADIIDDNIFEYQVFACNCQLTTDCRMTCDARSGFVVVPISSLINHGCNTNVDKMFLPSGKIAIFTVAPVKKGEQLFHTYGVGLPATKERRQLHLQELFHFTCKCQACEENWPNDPKQIQSSELDRAQIKIGTDFARCFPLATNSSVMKRSADWEFDEETLKHAVKLSELTYKHFDNIVLAWFYNAPYRIYIFKAFLALFGEKFGISDKCF